MRFGKMHEEIYFMQQNSPLANEKDLFVKQNKFI